MLRLDPGRASQIEIVDYAVVLRWSVGTVYSVKLILLLQHDEGERVESVRSQENTTCDDRIGQNRPRKWEDELFFRVLSRVRETWWND